jgi:hypothetical protein
MTIAQQIGRVSALVENDTLRREFFQVARLLCKHRGDAMAAHGEAQAKKHSVRVVNVLQKTAVAAGGLSVDIADYRVMSAAFNESLRSLSVFDAMLADGMTPAPLRSRGVTVTTGITGGVKPEGQVKVISQLVLGSALVEPRKSTGIIVISKELAERGDPAANALFNSELTKAVVAATDSVFLAALVAATTPTASAGSTLANITTDLGVLLSAVSNGANSKLYFVTSPTNMKKLVLKANTIGAPAFPFLGPNGGQIMQGVTAIASDQVPSATAIMVAADGVAGSAEGVILDGSSETMLQLDTAPDSPPTASTVPLSLWQTDNRALRAERWFGFTIFRATAVASLSGVNY